jgi:type VI secretion system protein ImpF
MPDTDIPAGVALVPSLLDRLTDLHPKSTGGPDGALRRESRKERVLSPRELKAVVLRDLEWLLNTVALSAVQDLSSAPEAAKSVINYGLPDLTGATASGVDKSLLERSIRQAILDFEPRILRGSLVVKVTVDESEMTHNAIGLEIEGMIWGQPAPQQLHVKSDIDLETGTVPLSGQRGVY